jgi:hypothetical protein
MSAFQSMGGAMHIFRPEKEVAAQCSHVQAKTVEQGEQGALSMTYIPTQTGFMHLEDSGKLLRAIFPDYPILEPHYPAPALEPISQGRADRSN